MLLNGFVGSAENVFELQMVDGYRWYFHTDLIAPNDARQVEFLCSNLF